MRKLLRGARIIDGVNPEPLEGHEIVIEGDSIMAIHAKTEEPLPGDEVVDLSGKTILPGLINMHVHLVGDPGENLIEEMKNKSDEQFLLQALKASQLALKSGVTTVRDCGSRNNVVHWLRDAINQGKLTGPRILSSGKIITATGGHAYFMAIEADGVDAVRKAVRAQIKSGSDFIKVMVTGGGGTPTTSRYASHYTDEELTAAVEEAHRLGKKVAVHAHGTRGILQSVKAGVDTIEHCSFVTESGRNVERDIIEQIKEKDIAVVATISSHIRLLYQGPFTVESFNQSVKKNLDYIHLRWKIFRDKYNSGANILAGNDAGTYGTPHHDFVTHLEMMAELGMKKKEVIESATCKAAKVLGLDHMIGTIEAGKKADLLAVQGDPLQDIGVLRNPSLIMVGGENVS